MPPTASDSNNTAAVVAQQPLMLIPSHDLSSVYGQRLVVPSNRAPFVPMVLPQPLQMPVAATAEPPLIEVSVAV